MAELKLNVNGQLRVVEAEPDTPLLYVLLKQEDLKNPRFGCGLAQCGACTVIVDGEATRSCVTPAAATEGRNIVNLEGLGSQDDPHPVQQAFAEEWALQCGYCINGWVMTAAAFLDKNPDPTDMEIREALTGLKCRCANHVRFLRAVKRAAEIKRTASTREEVGTV